MAWVAGPVVGGVLLVAVGCGVAVYFATRKRSIALALVDAPVPEHPPHAHPAPASQFSASTAQQSLANQPSLSFGLGDSTTTSGSLELKDTPRDSSAPSNSEMGEAGNGEDKLRHQGPANSHGAGAVSGNVSRRSSAGGDPAPAAWTAHSDSCSAPAAASSSSPLYPPTQGAYPAPPPVALPLETTASPWGQAVTGAPVYVPGDATRAADYSD